MSTLAWPATDEYLGYYGKYLEYLPRDVDVMRALSSQLDALPALLTRAGESRASYRYADGKWTVREVVGHLTDAERVFTYRMLRIGRGDETPLSGFDENAYVPAGQFERRPLAEVVAEWATTRRATMALASGFAPEAWTRRGTANDATISTRALLYIIVGHTEHHTSLLKSRYGLL
jgi:DinB superfamily